MDHIENKAKISTMISIKIIAITNPRIDLFVCFEAIDLPMLKKFPVCMLNQ